MLLPGSFAYMIAFCGTKTTLTKEMVIRIMIKIIWQGDEYFKG
jgi:hypothetical protein